MAIRLTSCCIHRLPPLDNAGEDVFEPSRIGYQVTWVQWDPRSFPAVDPPASVVLTDTDSIRDLAHSPCGAKKSGDGSEDGSKCFEAGVATSLRLDGLDESLGLAFAVRAVTTGGYGPLSRPVTVLPTETGETDDPDDPEGAPEGTPEGASDTTDTIPGSRDGCGVGR